MSNHRQELPQQVKDEIKSLPRGELLLDCQEAKKSLASLFWLGCDPVMVISYLDDYFEKNSADRKRTARDPDPERRPTKWEKRVYKLSRKLEKTARELETVKEELGSWNNPISRRTINDIRNVGELLADRYDSWLEAEYGRGEKVDLLAAAVKMVQMVTGKPHYRELAEIATVLAGKPILESNLRINVRNFRNKNFRFRTTVRDIRTEIKWGAKKWGALRDKLQSDGTR